MTTEIMPFDFNGNQVRTVTKDNETWFVAIDLTKTLDIKNTSDALKRLDDDERSRFNLGRQGEANIVSEAGLYSFIGASRKAEARKFMRWVNHEVLPSIRKHGAYMTDAKIEQVLTDPDTIIRLATELKTERQAKAELQQNNLVLNQQVNELKPKADYADVILNNKALVTITFIAKDYGMSGVKMNELLHELGVQYKQGTTWLLYAKHQRKGWTQSETHEVVKKDGTTKLVPNTKWTQKGRLGLYELLKENSYLPLIEKEEIA
ncbi:phage antirepressor KilAC domain-containing protein [Leuconostoc litchii]|uniref:Phage repressor protein/antirepressor Ant n=1 Tax=Leuconostoc litchii TaxID=1981069 RepID=A0A6P2CPC6_9LACO|nr:phage antirepressor [Leuconostoc litchii]TYC46831.1 phage repressor protein/antirepressor Ant [Leuconostoc litchii]GMA70725.1 phage antirepressor KilAC domain-containing protein [Leuconostoc litchii]GMA70795.1 phage antirepressor KilAC domain-containing protein [Leuconostoc litchii]